MDMIKKKLKTGKEVGFVFLDTKTEKMAAMKAGDASKLAGQLTFLNECIMMTLKEVDGSTVGYDDVSKLDDYFSMREIRELRDIFNEINFGDDSSPLE